MLYIWGKYLEKLIMYWVLTPIRYISRQKWLAWTGGTCSCKHNVHPGSELFVFHHDQLHSSKRISHSLFYCVNYPAKSLRGRKSLTFWLTQRPYQLSPLKTMLSLCQWIPRISLEVFHRQRSAQQAVRQCANSVLSTSALKSRVCCVPCAIDNQRGRRKPNLVKSVASLEELKLIIFTAQSVTRNWSERARIRRKQPVKHQLLKVSYPTRLSGRSGNACDSYW